MSKSDSPIGSHVHAVFTERLTTPAVRFAIDNYATLETDPHAAQWTTHFTRRRSSKCMFTAFQDGSPYHAARGHRD
jgi:hypothetical protein